MWALTGQVLFLSSILVSSRNVKNPLPSFDFHESKVSEESLKDDGHKIGAFVLRNLGADYKKSVDNFYAKAPSCLRQHSELPRLGNHVTPASSRLSQVVTDLHFQVENLKGRGPFQTWDSFNDASVAWSVSSIYSINNFCYNKLSN
jgi:hypothetical protein